MDATKLMDAVFVMTELDLPVELGDVLNPDSNNLGLYKYVCPPTEILMDFNCCQLRFIKI